MRFNDIRQAVSTYRFAIDHTDAQSLVDASSLGVDDVRLVGPDFDKKPSSAQLSSGTDQRSISVIYEVDGPIDENNNGEFSVILQPGEVSDTSQNSESSAMTIGTFNCFIEAVPEDQQIPRATLKNFPDITANTSAYDFTVEFTDDVLVELDSLSNSSIYVTGPNGFNRSATFLGSDVFQDSASVTGSFRLAENFNASGDGQYSVFLRSGGVRDTSGRVSLQTRIGTFNISIPSDPVDSLSPIVQQRSYPAITEQQSSYSFNITFTDDTAIDVATVGSGGVTVSGPNGYSETPLFLGTPSGDRSSVTADFQIQETFDATKDGIYTITVDADSVADTAGRRNVFTVVGTITVSVSSTDAPTGNTIAGVSVEFAGRNSLPSDWVARNVTVQAVSQGLRASIATPNSSWSNQIESPAFTPASGDRAILEWSGDIEQVAAGITESPSGGIDFGDADSLVWFNAGNFSDGNSQFAEAPTAPYGSTNRLTVEFGVSQYTAIAETSSGSNFTEVARVVRSIPQKWYNGAAFVVAHYGGVTGSVTIESTTFIKASPITEGVISQRSFPANWAGSNAGALEIDDYNTQDFTVISSSLVEVGTLALRLPGGDQANFWEYFADDSEGGLIRNADSIMPVASWHFHGGALPIWIYYQTNERTATRANMKRFFDASGAARFIWVANVNTGTPAEVVNTLIGWENIGLLPEWVEIGNELYFNIPYYSGSGDPGDGKFLRGHTTASAYMVDMRDNFVPAIRAQFGNRIKIAWPMVAKDSTTGSKENEWTPRALDTGLKEDCDGAALHPYYNIEDIGMQLSDVGNYDRAGQLAIASWNKQYEVIRRRSVSDVGDYPIIITEANLLEDPSQTSFVALGQTALHGLMLAINFQIYMTDPRVELALAHVAFGNAQWGMITDSAGTNIDASKRGREDNPFTNGYSTPFTPTVSGYMQGIQNRAIAGGGTAYLLVNEPAYMAHRVQGATNDNITLLNVTTESKSFTLPADRGWIYEQWTYADPWFEVRNSTEIPGPAVGSLSSGQTIAIPPFTQMSFEGVGEITEPTDTDGPTITIGTITGPGGATVTDTDGPLLTIGTITGPGSSAPADTDGPTITIGTITGPA